MLKIIHFIQNISLDITAGALVMTLFLAELYDVQLSGAMLLGLGIAIWLIYTADHLFDAYKSKPGSENPRHAFHQRYFKPLVGFGIIVFAVGLWNLQFLPGKTIWFGIALAVLSGLYLLYSFYSQRAIKKELLAALVYTGGLAAAPLSISLSISLDQLLILFQVFLLAYANLMLIPIFELKIDLKDKHDSIVTIKGKKRVEEMTKGLVLLSMALTLIQVFVFQENPSAQAIFFMMAIVILALLLKPELFKTFQLYRILADGIFFLPLIYLSL